MAIEVIHLEHTYTYRHPVGWSGGDPRVREELNEHRPASEYPAEEAEEIAVRHALKGILAGGEAFVPESGRHLQGGAVDSEVADVPVSAPAACPDRILEETGEEGRPGESTGDPDRILEETSEEGRSAGSDGDPDRILEG